MSNIYPAWICWDCGIKYGKGDCKVATWHQDTCGVCGNDKFCTEPRDFGHLKDSWKKHNKTKKP